MIAGPAVGKVRKVPPVLRGFLMKRLIRTLQHHWQYLDLRRLSKFGSELKNQYAV